MQDLHAIRPVADSWSISPDGLMATGKVLLVGGATITVTLPVHAIDAWAAQFHELFHLLRRMKHKGGGVLVRPINDYGVNTSPEFRGAVLFGFEPETPKELTFAMSGMKTLDFGRKLLSHAADVLTPEERQKALGQLPADVRPRGKIILPGGR